MILLTETTGGGHSAEMRFDESHDLGLARRKQRACLCCAGAFDSAWAGERVCPRCKGSATWRDDVAGNGANHARYQGKAARRKREA